MFERLKAVRGVSGAALSTGVPPSQGGFTWGELEAEGSAPLPGETTVPINTVSPSYFQALRIPIAAGRTFEPGDPPDATIVSRGFADRLWPGTNAVGRRYRFGATSPWRTVVGVAGNVESRVARRERTVLQIYYPIATRSTAPAVPAQASRRQTYSSRLLISARTSVGNASDVKQQSGRSIEPAGRPCRARVGSLREAFTASDSCGLMSVFARSPWR